MAILMQHRHPSIITYVFNPRTVGNTYEQFFTFCQADAFTMVEGLAVTEKRRITDEEAREVVRSIADALRHCHDLGIFHLDVKPDNILVQELGVYRLTDFGSSLITRQKSRMAGQEPSSSSSSVSPTGVVETAAATPLPLPRLKVRRGRGRGRGRDVLSGTITYAAPEALFFYNFEDDDDPDSADDAEKRRRRRLGHCDVWSLAMTIFVMRCGYMLWNVARAHEDLNYQSWCVAYEKADCSQLRDIITSTVLDAQLLCPDVHLPALGADFTDLLIRMLNPNPALRLTMQEVCEHPWLRPVTAGV